MTTGRPRVALVQPYWDFWEASVQYDLRADRARLGDEVRAALDVEWVDQADAECVLVLQTMATPPACAVLGSLGSACRKTAMRASTRPTNCSSRSSASRSYVSPRRMSSTRTTR